MKKTIIDLFTNHPDASEFHFTSDGVPFHQKSNAETHANDLKNKDVETITRFEALGGKKAEVVEEPEETGGDEELTHIITQEDLDNNPDLVGVVEVGDEVTFTEYPQFAPPAAPAADPAPAKKTAAKKAAAPKKTANKK